MAKAMDKAAGEKAKRGNGPYSVLFVTHDDQIVKRIPPNPKGVVFNIKDKPSKHISLADIPEANLRCLAAFGLAKRGDSKLRPITMSKEQPWDASTLVDATDDFAETIKSEKAFARAEKSTKSKAKPFAYDYWTRVISALQKKKKGTGFDDATTARFRAHLEALPHAERVKKVKGWQADPGVQEIEAAIRLQDARDAAKKGSEYSALDDIF